MRSRPVNGSLAVAFGASAVLHALVIVPILMALFAAGGASPRVEAFFKSEAPPPEPDDAAETERQPTLGIEESKVSTLTWIGYDTYLEHLARFSEVEQAAFTDTPTGAAAAEPAPSPQELLADAEPIEAIEDAASTEPIMASEAVHVAEHVEEEAVAAAEVEPGEPPLPLDLPSRLPEIDFVRIARVLELVGLTSRDRETGENPVTAEEEADVREAASESIHAADTPENSAEEPVDAPQPEAGVGTSPAEPSDAPGEPANSADKQSDATSVIEVTHANWRLGRPLAAQGIELKPQRPHFSIMQRLTASPCNPLVEIQFNRAGAATSVTTIETSRDASINAAIEASAYRWRAEGEEISRLRENQTFAVRIRFILNPYARCP